MNNTLDNSDPSGSELNTDWALRELADGWIANNEREGEFGFYRNAKRVLDLIANDAATLMRSACIEKVKETEFLHHVDCATAVNKEAVCTCFAATIKSRLIAALESVTIQE